MRLLTCQSQSILLSYASSHYLYFHYSHVLPCADPVPVTPHKHVLAHLRSPTICLNPALRLERLGIWKDLGVSVHRLAIKQASQAGKP